MKKTLIGLLALLMLGGMVSLAQALDVTVSVTITSEVGITLVSGGAIDFGSMAPGAEADINATPTVIKNSGSGVTQTYKMYATSPSNWSAGTTTVHDTYVLQAAFNDTLPTGGTGDDFDTLDNKLGEGSGNEKTASSTVLTIDGDPNGANVAYDENRSIYYEFQPPATSSLTGTQDITVTITAVTP